MLLTETLHTLLLLAVLVATFRLARTLSWKDAALLGVIMGVSVYVRPILLLFPSVIAVLCWLAGGGGKRSIGLAALSMFMALLVMSPWTLRNFLELDGFVLTATNGGFNFYMGNGPDGTGTFRDMSSAYFGPSNDPLRFQSGYRLGIEYILGHPIEWLATLPKKAFYLWVGDFPRLIQRVEGVALLCFWAILTLAAVAATFSRSIRGYWLRFPVALIPLTLVYWTAFHLMFFGIGRFHTQMIPLVMIMAAHLLEPSWDKLRQLRRLTPIPRP